MKQCDSWRICVIFGPFGSLPPNAYVHVASVINLLKPLAEEIFAITGNFPENAISSQKIHIINITDISDRRQPMLMRIPRFILLQLKMSYNLIKIASRIDVVFLAAGASTLFLPALSAKLLRKRIIFMRHGTDSFQKTVESYYQNTLFGVGKYIFAPILDTLIRLNCSLSDRLAVFRSDFTDPALKRYTNKILSAGSRFYVDIESFKVDKNIENRENLVGHVGHLEEINGVMNFVKAIPLILRESSAVSFLIGGDGSLLDEIEREIKDVKLSDKVTLTGWIPHNKVPQYLNQLKLLVIPLFIAVGPQILFEAMACGTPVLAAPGGVVPDMIRDGETGFIMEDNSPQCIARNVIRALNHPNLSQIAKTARELVEREYTHEAAVERYRRILASLK